MPKSLDQGPLCYINMRLLRLRHWRNNGNGRNANFVATIWQWQFLKQHNTIILQQTGTFGWSPAGYRYLSYKILDLFHKKVNFRIVWVFLYVWIFRDIAFPLSLLSALFFCCCNNTISKGWWLHAQNIVFVHELIFINYILRHSFTNHEKFINTKKKEYI